MIRLVLLDWGGVLTAGEYDRRVSRDLAERTGLPEEELYRAWREGKRRAYERGEVELEEVWEELAARFALRGGSAGFVAILRGAIVPDAAVIDLLAPLRSRVALGILSNNYPAVSILVRKSLGACFDRLFFSDETGCCKPDPRAYREPLEAFGVAPADALFVDDKQRNLTAGRELGMQTHLHVDAATLRADLVSRGLLVA